MRHSRDIDDLRADVAANCRALIALAEREGCKIVLVTSSLQGEGKSITALNLAISFAEAENRVLLIDRSEERR